MNGCDWISAVLFFLQVCDSARGKPEALSVDHISLLVGSCNLARGRPEALFVDHILLLVGSRVEPVQRVYWLESGSCDDNVRHVKRV